MAIYKPNLIN